MIRRPRTASRLEDFGELFDPSEAAEPILARGVRQALTEWLTEIWAEDELIAAGASPRKRAMFTGAPGTGKTTLAHHLAGRLGLRMLAVRPDRLISKWSGQTSEQIGELFTLAAEPTAAEIADGSEKTEPVLLFFDEFDAVSRQRRRSEQGIDDEKNAIVDTMLQRIEQHRGYLVAATNYAESIDQAIWRRFDMHITLELPGQGERERILARYFAPFVLPKAALHVLAESCETASPALMRALAENIKRTLIVGPKLGADMEKRAVFGRVLSAIHPHPDLGKPRLWSLGTADPAIGALPWPLSRDATPVENEMATSDSMVGVVPFRRPAP